MITQEYDPHFNASPMLMIIHEKGNREKKNEPALTILCSRLNINLILPSLAFKCICNNKKNQNQLKCYPHSVFSRWTRLAVEIINLIKSFNFYNTIDKRHLIFWKCQKFGYPLLTKISVTCFVVRLLFQSILIHIDLIAHNVKPLASQREKTFVLLF